VDTEEVKGEEEEEMERDESDDEMSRLFKGRSRPINVVGGLFSLILSRFRVRVEC
jgi:hypothetical protein